MDFFLVFSPRTEMTEENLKWLENVFRRTVGENGEIRLQDFKNIVHSKNVSLIVYLNSSAVCLQFGCLFTTSAVCLQFSCCFLQFFYSFQFFSHFSLNGYFTFSTKMTTVVFHCKNSSMPCTNLPDKVLMTKSSFCSKSMTLTVRIPFSSPSAATSTNLQKHVECKPPRLFQKMVHCMF